MKTSTLNFSLIRAAAILLLVITISMCVNEISSAETIDLSVTDEVITGTIYDNGDGTMTLKSNYLQLTWNGEIYTHELTDGYLRISKTDDRFTYTFSLIAAQHEYVENLSEYTIGAMSDYYGEDNIKGNVLAITAYESSDDMPLRFIDTGVQHSTVESSVFSHVRGIADDETAFVYALTITGDGEDVLDFYEENYKDGTDHELIDVEMDDLLQTMVLVTN